MRVGTDEVLLEAALLSASICINTNKKFEGDNRKLEKKNTSSRQVKLLSLVICIVVYINKNKKKGDQQDLSRAHDSKTKAGCTLKPQCVTFQSWREVI